MTTIVTIENIRICKFKEEINNVHIVDGRFYAVIDLIDFKIIRGQLPIETYKKVIRWLEVNAYRSN